MSVKIEKVEFKGWPDSYRVTNGEVELIVTGDVGPRIIRYGFVGGRNLFKEFPDQLGKSGESAFRIRGGHRLWVGPEYPPDSPITYSIDNSPVNIRVKGSTLIATPPLEAAAGVQKQIVVKMAAAGSGVEVLHRITNRNPWPVEFAAWPITVMAPGGTGITGLPPRGTHPEMLSPTNPLVIWAFTDLSDKRWRFTRKYILLHQDPKVAAPQKIGSFSADTFGAYHLGNELFMKRYRADPGRIHPDMGASFEMFTNHEVLELETMGPLTKLAPGATLAHIERWSLRRSVKIGKWSDAELDGALLPLI
jgi:hypothetical protein